MNRKNDKLQPNKGSSKVQVKSHCAGRGSKIYVGSVYQQSDNNFNVNRTGVRRRSK